MKRLCSLVLMAGVLTAEAKLELGYPFADNMVLQRDLPVRIWGTADAGEKVKVSFADQTIEALADARGEWRAELRPLAASEEPRPLTVSSVDQSETVSVSNVLVGEVWFASGQSNMEMKLVGDQTRYRDVQGRLVSQWTRRPNVRFVHIPFAASRTPERRSASHAAWKGISPTNVEFSALAWYYAVELQAALNVPVGIVCGAVGGSRIQPFIPKEGFAAAGLDVAQETDPCSKWNGMISPWTPMTMRGFIWYQGCSNIAEHERYGRLMDALYKGWSAAFENPKLHLNFVQLAPWGDGRIARMQEAQDRYARSEPNATMAVISDNGNVSDIHPSDKETVAKRLVALALKHDYGFDIKAEAPSFKAARASGDLVEVSFKDAEWLSDYPDQSGSWCKAFELAGDDGVYVPATIVNYKLMYNLLGQRLLSCGDLIGSNVYLRAEGVAKPKKIRYLHSSPWDSQMFNEVGLPLKAFESEIEETDGQARIVWEISFMEDVLRAMEAKFRGEVSVAKYRNLVRTVNGVSVWTDAINAALTNGAQVVRIPASADPYYVDGSLIVPSRRRILAEGATIRLLKPCDTVLLRNEKAADGTRQRINRTQGDTDISIEGGRWEDWQTTRMGYGKSGRFNDGPREIGTNFYGVSALFYLGNLTRLSIRNVTIVNAGGFAIQCGDTADAIFENIEFQRCFADGLHLNGGIRRVLARDIRGDVGDDLVALNVYDWQSSSVNFGVGDTILCEKLRLRSGYPAIRLQPGVYRFADGTKIDCALRNVLLRDVRGINCFKMYLQTPKYEIGTAPEWGEVGSAQNLWFEDVTIDLDFPPDRFETYLKGDPLRGHFGAFEIGANVDGLHFVDVRANLHLEKYPLAHFVSVGPKSCVWKGTDGKNYEVFDPWVSCTVKNGELKNVTYSGWAPAEAIHATSFNDVNGDGRSSGQGKVLK